MGGTQDLGPFNLGPIIAAITNEQSRKKRKNKDMEEGSKEKNRDERRVQNRRILYFSEAEETSCKGSPGAP